MDGDGGPGIADVEGLPEGRLVVQHQQDAPDDVVDVAPASDLGAIVVDQEVLVGEGPDDELVDRSLAHLAGTIDIEGAHGGGREAVLLVEVVGQVFGGQLGHGVGPAGLAHLTELGGVTLSHLVGVAAEDLAGGEVHEALDPALAVGGVQEVHGAQHGHLHGQHGAAHDGVHAGDGGHVDDDVGALDRLGHAVLVHHITLEEGDPGVPIQGRAGEGVAVQIVQDHQVIGVAQLEGQGGAQEASATGDEYPFAFNHLVSPSQEGPRAWRVAGQISDNAFRMVSGLLGPRVW